METSKCQLINQGLTPYNLGRLQASGVDAFWLDIKAHNAEKYKWQTGCSNEHILKLPEEILKLGFTLEVLSLYISNLCFEYSPTRKPMIVSVVTRGQSDDCNSVMIDKNTVYLRIYRQANTLAFHYLEDGSYWHLVRYFSIGQLRNLQVGFSAQAPTGARCQVQFSEIKYLPGELSDLRNGE